MGRHGRGPRLPLEVLLPAALPPGRRALVAAAAPRQARGLVEAHRRLRRGGRPARLLRADLLPGRLLLVSRGRGDHAALGRLAGRERLRARGQAHPHRGAAEGRAREAAALRHGRGLLRGGGLLGLPRVPRNGLPEVPDRRGGGLRPDEHPGLGGDAGDPAGLLSDGGALLRGGRERADGRALRARGRGRGRGGGGGARGGAGGRGGGGGAGRGRGRRRGRGARGGFGRRGFGGCGRGVERGRRGGGRRGWRRRGG